MLKPIETTIEGIKNLFSDGRNTGDLVEQPAPLTPQQTGDHTEQAATMTLAPQQETEVVKGVFIEAQTLSPVISAKIERITAQVQSFSSGKEDGQLGRVVHGLFRWLALLAPPALGVLVGWMIGDAFTSAYPGSLSWSAYSHGGAVLLELFICMLVFGAAAMVPRIKTPHSGSMALFVLALLFACVLIVISALAQYNVFEMRLPPDKFSVVMVAFRTIIPPAIDVGSLLYLTITRRETTETHIQKRQAEQRGIQALAQEEIALSNIQLQAALNQQQAVMEAQMKLERAQAWNEAERMHNQAMLDDTRRRMLGDGTEGGYRKRKYY